MVSAFVVVYFQNENRKKVSSKYKYDEIFWDSWKAFWAIDFGGRKIIVGSGDNADEFAFAQIISVEIVENETTLTNTTRNSPLLRAAVGGLVFGGVGAIVGGMSASSSSQSRSRVKSVNLKLAVDDRSRPIHKICFLKSGPEGESPDSSSVKNARFKADRLHAHLLNAMRQVLPPIAAIDVPQTTTGADELQKFWDMKQAGILNDDEFARQKDRILSQSEHFSGGRTLET
jgi:hypothetical protein